MGSRIGLAIRDDMLVESRLKRSRDAEVCSGCERSLSYWYSKVDVMFDSMTAMICSGR